MESYSFALEDNKLREKISSALYRVLKGETPIICCIGTDAVSGDSLGPVTGTMLKNKLLGKTYLYGTLDKPITAKDVPYASRFIRAFHPETPILAIDAALGEAGEVGNVKISASPVKPGLGVKKDLSEVGNCSIIAVVEEKRRRELLSSVRISLIYRLAGEISDGIQDYLEKIAYGATSDGNSEVLSAK